MSFAAPAGLFALLALGPLWATYFLRRRQKPLPVSALFLWRSRDLHAQQGPRWQRLSRELSLLLETLAVAALAVFLATPTCGPPSQQRHLVLVVDDSLSMAARPGTGKTLVERVRQAAAAEVERTHATAVTVVQSGEPPRLLAGPAESPDPALASLEHWEPRGPGSGWEQALSFAHELAGATGAVTVLTDGAPPPQLLPTDSWISVGEPLDNVAFVAAQRRDEGSRTRLLVRVQSFARQPRAVDVLLRAESLDPGSPPLTHTEHLALQPGELRAVQWDLGHAGPIHADLPDDALPEDGHLVLPPSPERAVQVQLSKALDPLTRSSLARGFASVDGVLLVDAGGDIRVGPEPEAQLLVRAPAPERSFVGPFFASRETPLLEDVELSGVVWTASTTTTGPAVLAAGEVALLAEQPGGGLLLNLDLSRSNLARTPAWPVLLANLARRAHRLQPGFAHPSLMLGQQVELVSGKGPAQVEGPDGVHPLLQPGAVALPGFVRPGTYRLIEGGRVTDTTEVLALAPSESDLRDRVGAHQGRTRPLGGSDPLQSRRSPWPLALVLALVALDFAVSGRSG